MCFLVTLEIIYPVCYIWHMVIKTLIERIRFFWELQYFGVCEKMSDKIGVSTSSVRMFFIYSSFIALGSPVIIYITLFFIMNIRKHLRMRRSFYYDI